MNTLPHFDRVAESETDWFEALMNLARYLRTPDGCPWDREQNSGSFANYAKGEAEELIEAIESGDNEHIAEEFGDTLFTLLATAAAAEEEGRFKLTDALEKTHIKMIRRHEHVFGDERATTAEEAEIAWEKAKRDEKNR
jgi:tetrapyrrole methylase family protein / MazG family protein